MFVLLLLTVPVTLGLAIANENYVVCCAPFTQSETLSDEVGFMIFGTSLAMAFCACVLMTNACFNQVKVLFFLKKNTIFNFIGLKDLPIDENERQAEIVRSIANAPKPITSNNNNRSPTTAKINSSQSATTKTKPKPQQKPIESDKSSEISSTYVSSISTNSFKFVLYNIHFVFLKK